MNAAAMECRPLAGGEAERHYLESLNVCFPGWGGRDMFDWCFTRESAGLRPDLMTLHDEAGRAVAGTANTYRRVRLPNGETLVAGIMTGSWTLPEARGRGLFTRLIGEMIEMAAAREAALLLGFYARTNPSAGRLAAAGFGLSPSWHIRSPERPLTAADVTCIEEQDEGASAIADHQDVADTVRLVYTAGEWRDQFVRRPNPVTRVRGADRWSALVERTASFDRVLSLTCSPASTPEGDDSIWADAVGVLDARAVAAGRRVFVYTTNERHAAAARDRGFEIVDGWVSALVANEASLRAAITADSDANGSRDALRSAPAPSSSASHALADPASPWFLGRWFVRNGDRM